MIRSLPARLKALSFYLLPACALLAAASFLYLPSDARAAETGLATAVGWLSFAASGYCIVLVARLRSTKRENYFLGENARVSEKRSRYVERRNRELRSQIDVLSAMREISRIVNSDVNFTSMLAEILRIIGGLIDPREVTLLLREADTDELVPKAQLRLDTLRFDDEVVAEPECYAEAVSAWEHGRITRSLDDHTLKLAIPLDADKEAFGVLRIVVPVDGTSQEQSAKVAQHEASLREIAKHIALSVKTSRLHSESILDSLTGLFTKGHFRQELASNADRARRHGTTFSLVMMDIDHFKQTNDTHGHLTGDIVLSEVAGLLRSQLRKYDTAYRYGGEELALLLPETTLEHGLKIAERVRGQIESKQFVGDKGQVVPITISLGVAEHENDLPRTDELIHRADQALYHAKRTGRNRAVPWSEVEQESPDQRVPAS